MGYREWRYVFCKGFWLNFLIGIGMGLFGNGYFIWYIVILYIVLIVCGKYLIFWVNYINWKKKVYGVELFFYLVSIIFN